MGVIVVLISLALVFNPPTYYGRKPSKTEEKIWSIIGTDWKSFRVSVSESKNRFAKSLAVLADNFGLV